MIIAGIDYSMNSPAICVYDTEKDFKFENLKFYNTGTLKTCTGTFGNIEIALIKPYSSQEERFRESAAWAMNVLLSNKVESATIEGYSMGASSGLVFQIAENTSLVKQGMNLHGIDFETPSPTSVKKNFCGKGNMKKDGMVDHFYDQMFPGIVLHDIIKRPTRMSKPCDDLVDGLAVLLCHKHFKKV